MGVAEKDAGIVDKHVLAVQSVAVTENIFIFVRPTEFDTTQLIRAGYATKSMDVHHKSCNWGPAAGFVPVDPAFSKKTEGKPNPAIAAPHRHGDEHPTQLTLMPSLLVNNDKIAFKDGFTLAPKPQGGALTDYAWVAKRTTAKTGVAAARERFESFQTSGSLPNHKFCTANPAEIGNKSTLFCLIEKGGEWAVFWVLWEGETGKLIPLQVFAYPQKGRLVPVTGDYDLWMVAPHFTHFDQASITRIEQDSHGKSAASNYTVGLLAQLNLACGRQDNPVFNHGAEAQNYGFTQALDWNLAMFTPSGMSRMVRMNEMPGILADLQRAGYLVVWNKRYGENDPQLMHRKDDRKDLGEIRRTIDDLFSQLENIRLTADPKAIARQAMAQTGQQRAMPGAMKSELELMAQRFAATRNLGLEQSRIYRFHRQLLTFLDGQDAPLRSLNDADFPGGYRVYRMEERQLHMSLQKVMVDATTGDGQSDDKLTAWMQANRQQIDRLKTFWK